MKASRRKPSRGCDRAPRRECRGEPNVRSEFPTGFFCADVLLHQLGDHFVLLTQLGLLALELLLQVLHASLGDRGGLPPPPGPLQGPRRVLEETPLPLIDLVRLDAVLVTQVRDGDLLDQIPLQDGSLLVGAKVPSLGRHRILLVQGSMLTQKNEEFHFRLVQDKTRCRSPRTWKG